MKGEREKREGKQSNKEKRRKGQMERMRAEETAQMRLQE